MTHEMISRKKKNRLGKALAIAAGVAATWAMWPTPVEAQTLYRWEDEKGVVHFSNQPPKPEERGAKNQKAWSPKTGVATDTAKDVFKESKNAKGKDSKEVSKNEKEKAVIAAEDAKKKEENAGKEKEAAEKARVEAKNAKSCEQAQEAIRVLSSGQKIRTVNKAGETEILGDEQRGEKLKDAQEAAKDSCKS